MKNDHSVWILEDDPGIQFVYEEALEWRYRLRFFSKVGIFQKALHEDPPPQLLIADLRLPDQTFLSFLTSLDPSKKLTFPFIVVSSIDDLDALRTCFGFGAADYLTKPFKKAELTVKIERLLETQKNLLTSMVQHEESWSLDPTTFSVCRNQNSTESLTSKEFQILSVMQQAPNHTISREKLCSMIWSDVAVTHKTLDVHLVSLRKKLSRLKMEVHLSSPGHFTLRLKPLDEIPDPLSS